MGAVIIEDDRVVLVKRGHAPCWSGRFPEACWKFGETSEAVVREAREETGLTMSPENCWESSSGWCRRAKGRCGITTCWSISCAGG